VELLERPSGRLGWIQLFVRIQAELEARAPRGIPATRGDSKLWVSFPKGGFKTQTGLARDLGWDTLRDVDLNWFNSVSVNETWSPLGLRTYKPGETEQKLPWVGR
jgi:hypothetical protein